MLGLLSVLEVLKLIGGSVIFYQRSKNVIKDFGVFLNPFSVFFFSLLMFPLVRSASQFKRDVVMGQAGFMLLVELRLLPHPQLLTPTPRGSAGTQNPQ